MGEMMEDGAVISIDMQRPGGYSLGEEIANSITHGIGAVLGVAGLAILIVLSSQRGDGWALGACIAYGISLVLLYTASTLYHAFPWPRVKKLFKVFDHAGIYLLIAGTYTPYSLVTLRAHGGWWLFAAVWTLAVVGIAAEAFWVYRPKWISTVVYLGMGWLAVVLFRPLAQQLTPTGFWLLIAGGLAYSLGTVFYVLKRLPYAHAIWHGFVLAGSVLHFLSVVLGVLRPA